MKKLFNISNKEKIAFFVTMIATFIVYLSVFKANLYYADDVYRGVAGSIRMADQGRPFGHLLLMPFKLGGLLIDASPLFQIIAIIEVAITPIALLRLFKGISWLESVIMTLLVFMSPFYIQNISFKFDIYTMTTAVFLSFCSILAFFNIYHWGGKVVSWLCILLVISSYQPALNVVFVFFITRVIYGVLLKEKNILIKSGGFLGVCLCAALTYKLSLPVWFRPTEYSAHGAEILDKNIIQSMLQTHILFLKYVFVTSNVYYIVCVLGLFLFSFISFLINIKDRWYKKWAYVFFYYLSIILCCSGLMSLLKNPILEPRTMIGVGGICASLFLIGAQVKVTKKIIFSLSIVFIFKNIIIFMAYGNALDIISKQIGYNVAISLEKASELSNNYNVKKGAVIGRIPDSNYIKEIKKKIPIMAEILKTDFGDISSYNIYNIDLYTRGLSFEYMNISMLRDEDLSSTKKIYEGGFFEILLTKSNIIIVKYKD